MKIFLSWSGSTSRAIASALHDWLPYFLPFAKPWMSDKDIGKGKSWQRELNQELRDVSIGLLCLTPQNIDSPWLHFEAGAIAKAMENSHICTYLYQLKPTDIIGPLAEFQHTSMNKDDTRKMMITLNNVADEKLPDKKMETLFDKFWPDLEKGLMKIPVETEKHVDRSDSDKIDEILLIARSLVTLRTPPRGHLGIDFADKFGTGVKHYEEYLNIHFADYIRRRNL